MTTTTREHALEFLRLAAADVALAKPDAVTLAEQRLAYYLAAARRQSVPWADITHTTGWTEHRLRGLLHPKEVAA